MTTDPAPRAPRAFVAANFVQACCWFVPRLPLPGETLQATRMSVEPGGKGLNVAIGLQRLGLQVHALIGVGSDDAGQRCRALLSSSGLPLDHVHVLPGHSGWGSGWIGEDGRNAIAVYPGANLALTPEHAQAAEADIARSAFVYAQFETSMPAVERVLQLAARNGVATILNPSPWLAPGEPVRHCTRTLIVNEVEAAALLEPGEPLPAVPADGVAEAGGDYAEPFAAAVTALLPALGRRWPALQRLVVTLGAAGAMLFRVRPDGESPAWLFEPAPRVDAVDTVGAGDAFAAAWCAAIARGLDERSALVKGNAAGAWVASRPGVLEPLLALSG